MASNKRGGDRGLKNNVDYSKSLQRHAKTDDITSIRNIAINRLSYEYDAISGQFIHSFIVGTPAPVCGRKVTTNHRTNSVTEASNQRKYGVVFGILG